MIFLVYKQLQSESTHLQNHLVSAVGEIMNNNMEKLEKIKIDNNHFLLFGDNGKKPALQEPNNHKISIWEKVWLAQRTGRLAHKYPIHFKLYLTDELEEYFKKYPEETLWLLQDKFIDNSEISEFDSENIVYYEADLNLDNGTALF